MRWDGLMRERGNFREESVLCNGEKGVLKVLDLRYVKLHGRVTMDGGKVGW